MRHWLTFAILCCGSIGLIVNLGTICVVRRNNQLEYRQKTHLIYTCSLLSLAALSLIGSALGWSVFISLDCSFIVFLGGIYLLVKVLSQA